MGPKYKVIYWDQIGFAEPIRWILSHVEADWEDVRLTQEEWKDNVKPRTLWAQLPIIEEDGELLAQTKAIVRYLGRKYGLHPKDNFSTAKCDEYMDAMQDLFNQMHKIYDEENPEIKKAHKQDIENGVFPEYYTKFESLLEKNGTGFFVGDSLSYVDIYIGFFSEYLWGFMMGYLPEVPFSMDWQDFPKLKKHAEMVNELPGIKEWIEKRPKNPY